MAGYSPLKITGSEGGLVQDREEFLLANDAYPKLQNAYIFRERILRKKGYQLLGRLQRSIDLQFNLVTGARNIFNANSLEPTATLVPGTLNVIGQTDGTVYTDPLKNGSLTANFGSGTGGFINYTTGVIRITGGGNQQLVGSIQYYPGIPVMGLRTRELQNSANDQLLVFDQNYAYFFNSGTNSFEEFIPGVEWNNHGANVSGTDFFWSTNYWVSDVLIPGTATPFFTTANAKLFWVTNNTGQFGAGADPIRITDGNTWVDFSPPNFGQIDATNYLVQCQSFLPFRGRMLAFNTFEGPTFGNAINYSNRIRWSTIGNPFIIYAAGPPATGSWRDDIRGQGGFFDIPTSEDIISVGFVRDNLVIYCERSTWQLRYTGRSIAPFQIEKVNSELGALGPFSGIQFDTSLVGIGDKGIVECDSYKSERIDIKIPDFVFKFQSTNNGPFRVHGIRDFVNRLAFWTVPLDSDWVDPIGATTPIFPTQRLLYNYENDSWAMFNDSLTCLGNYQPQSSRTWKNTALAWIQCNFPWKDNSPADAPIIVGGNQQGFVEKLDQLNTNDVSLFIDAITSDNITATVITSPNHNMRTGFVIGISGILGTPFASLNGGIFSIVVLDPNTFSLYKYNSVSGNFDIPQIDTTTTLYIGGGLINIRENFSILSKKFNFMEDGQSIQLGYLDILMSSTGISNPGAISLFVYLDYNIDNASNVYPNNIASGSLPVYADSFFNSVIPTVASSLNKIGGTKYWQRVFCSTRANFLTIEYGFSNAQMAGIEQQQQVQIDAQILWLRKAGRISQI